MTTHLLGATGKRHNHEEVHEIRRTFHGMREEHEVSHARHRRRYVYAMDCETKLDAMPNTTPVHPSARISLANRKPGTIRPTKVAPPPPTFDALHHPHPWKQLVHA